MINQRVSEARYRGISLLRMDIAAFISLNILDVLLTIPVMSWGGRQLNPLYSYFSSAGTMVMVKALLLAIVLLLLARYHRLHLLRWINLILAAMIVWNFVAATTYLA
jgi:hypothetical protein